MSGLAWVNGVYVGHHFEHCILMDLTNGKKQQDQQLLDGLATAKLWGSFAQLASAVGCAGTLAPGLFAAGGAALKLLSANSFDEPLQSGEYFASSSADDGGLFAPQAGNKYAKIVKQEILNTPPAKEEDVVWVTSLPQAKDADAQETIIGKELKATSEGERQYEKFMNKQMHEGKSRAESGKAAQLSIKELIKQGFAKNFDGSYVKVVEKDPVKVELDATETVTKLKTRAASYQVTSVQMYLPKVVWEKQVIKLVSKIPGQSEVETVNQPAKLTREAAPMEVNVVKPTAVKKKSRGHVCHGPHCCGVATMAPIAAAPIAAAPMMMMQAGIPAGMACVGHGSCNGYNNGLKLSGSSSHCHKHGTCGHGHSSRSSGGASGGTAMTTIEFPAFQRTPTHFLRNDSSASTAAIESNSNK